MFYAESDLVQPGNLCPIHNRPIEWVEEPNWFFPLKKWAPKLLELYDRNPEFVRPRTRYNEARSLIEGGLEDVSFSRATVSWGVPLPWEPSQTIYVWVDALSTTAPRSSTASAATSPRVLADLAARHGQGHPAAARDRLAGDADGGRLRAAQGLFVHGYFTTDGQKMSKTLGT